jgi:hypothetical protein
MAKNHHPLYLSLDVEADGPIPGRFSMLQFGVAAFDLGNDIEAARIPVATFESNLMTLDEASTSRSTMDWWDSQGDAYASTRINPQPPGSEMPRFIRWIKSLDRKVIVIGYPATYDFMFLYWYTLAFGGLADGERCPFGFSGLDIKTLASAKMGVPFPAASKRRMPKRWFKGTPKHNHDGLTDAIGQGVLFVNIMLDRDDG